MEKDWDQYFTKLDEARLHRNSSPDYYSNALGQFLSDPLSTISSKEIIGARSTIIDFFRNFDEKYGCKIQIIDKKRRKKGNFYNFTSFLVHCWTSLNDEEKNYFWEKVCLIVKNIQDRAYSISWESTLEEKSVGHQVNEWKEVL